MRCSGLLGSLLTHMSSFRAEDLELEGSYYIGIVLSAVIYGIYLGVYSLSVWALLENTSTTRLRRSIYILFSSVQLLLNAIVFMATPYSGMMAWIGTRDHFPGGPFAYFNSEALVDRVSLLGNMTQTIAGTLNDGLLAYRCYIVFGSKFYVVILPILCTLGSLALGTASIALYSNPHPFLADINAAAIALTTAVNVILTAMISIKILFVARSLRKDTNLQTSQARMYTNVVTILVESAAPCAILGVLTCASMFTTNEYVYLSELGIFLTWSMSIMLFPQLIIYRVARGNAWTEKTSQELTQATRSLTQST